MKNTIKLFILIASMSLGVTYAARPATLTFNGIGLDTLGTSTYEYVLSIRKREQGAIGTMTVTEDGGLLGTFPLENGSIHGNVISFLVEDDEGFMYHFSLVRLGNVLEGGVVELNESGLTGLTVADFLLAP